MATPTTSPSPVVPVVRFEGAGYLEDLQKIKETIDTARAKGLLIGANLRAHKVEVIEPGSTKFQTIRNKIWFYTRMFFIRPITFGYCGLTRDLNAINKMYDYAEKNLKADATKEEIKNMLKSNPGRGFTPDEAAQLRENFGRLFGNEGSVADKHTVSKSTEYSILWTIIGYGYIWGNPEKSATPQNPPIQPVILPTSSSPTLPNKNAGTPAYS